MQHLLILCFCSPPICITVPWRHI